MLQELDDGLLAMTTQAMETLQDLLNAGSHDTKLKAALAVIQLADGTRRRIGPQAEAEAAIRSEERLQELLSNCGCLFRRPDTHRGMLPGNRGFFAIGHFPGQHTSSVWNASSTGTTGVEGVECMQYIQFHGKPWWNNSPGLFQYGSCPDIVQSTLAHTNLISRLQESSRTRQ
jgi:hypothetical protein